MDKFERLNRETRDYNNGITRRIDPTGNGRYDSHVHRYGTASAYFNYLNNQTYKANNGQYSKKYY